MRKAFRIAMVSGVLVAGFAVAGAPIASAQVRVGGSFRLPHGHVSFSIGDRFPVGGYVPYGYDVYRDARYGYGFPYEEQWIPCEPRGSRWVIVGAPVHYGYRDRYYRDGRYGNDLRYRRDDRRFDRDRRWRRDDGRRDRDRRWRRDDRRRDDRRYGGDRRPRDRDRRWRR